MLFFDTLRDSFRWVVHSVVARLLIFFVLAGFAIPAFASHATLPEPCHDITGQGTDVLIGGVPNAGKVVFDPYPGPNPIHDYEACVTDPGNDTKGMYNLKGWSWDDNLGWVSFYCDGADNNLGRPCGMVAYGVKMEGTDQPNPGRLHGCAWSDNIGWISFNNSDPAGECGGSAVTYYVQAETVDGACLGQVSAAGCPNNGATSTFAWADSVGWLDFTGVLFPWVELISSSVSVSFEIVPNPAGINKLNAPLADGTAAYKMFLYFKDTFGNPVDVSVAPYDVNINVQWNEDTVKKDQTALVIADFKTCKNDASGVACTNSAVNKPLTKTDFVWDGALSAYTADITSIAPTSAMNGYDKNGDGVTEYSYEKFDLGNPNGGNNVQPNNLKLADVAVSVVNTATTFCSFGEAGCVPKALNTGVQPLEFKPGVEVTQFSQNNQDFLQGQNTVANNVNTTTVCLLGNSCGFATIDFISGIDAPFIMVVPTSDGDPAATPADAKDILNSSGFGSAVLQWTPLCTLETCQAFGGNPYVYSVVESAVAGKAVKYFSNKLPRVKGTLVVNPIASISGSVYSTGITNPQSGTVVRSLGDVSTNILRDTIFRNVSSIIAGASTPNTTTVTLTPDSNNKGFQGGGITLLPDPADSQKTPKVYYFKGDVRFDNGATAITWKGDRTVIVVGGNVYINSDLYNTGVTPKPKLGIIVLKDFVTNKGGNIYVAPNVKNIQANIFADGSFFSYDGTPGGVTASGLPYFDDEADRSGTLLHQLYVQGTLATQNTIGGAVKTPNPILGDGTVTTADEGAYGNNPSGRSRARLYDLNFLRYYGYVFERNPVTGDAIDQPPQDGQIIAKPVAEGGDLILNPGGQPAQGLSPGQASTVYIEFDPPTPTLPGFNVTGGVDVQVKPQ